MLFYISYKRHYTPLEWGCFTPCQSEREKNEKYFLLSSKSVWFEYIKLNCLFYPLAAMFLLNHCVRTTRWIYIKFQLAEKVKWRQILTTCISCLICVTELWLYLCCFLCMHSCTVVEKGEMKKTEENMFFSSSSPYSPLFCLGYRVCVCLFFITLFCFLTCFLLPPPLSHHLFTTFTHLFVLSLFPSHFAILFFYYFSLHLLLSVYSCLFFLPPPSFSLHRVSPLSEALLCD